MTERDVNLASDDADFAILRHTMLSTGLSTEAVKILFEMDDDDLDALCDAALSEVAVPSKKVAISRQ